jgi:purine-nucleoside phosphorylase
MATFDALARIARSRPPGMAFVLGSGLGDLASLLCDPIAVPFADIPGLARTSVVGHRGELLYGDWADVPVLIWAGRLHYYEGHPWAQVVRPIEITRDLGAKSILLTNAVGGIRDDLVPGSIVAIRDHIQCTRSNWWQPFAHGRTAPVSPYAPGAIARLQACARELAWTLSTGVYAQNTGPCYETPAEVRALRSLGADVVGMSTAREIQAGFEMGLECAALSCVTNRAAGLSAAPIHHGEVLEIAKLIKGRLIALLENYITATIAASPLPGRAADPRATGYIP